MIVLDVPSRDVRAAVMSFPSAKQSSCVDQRGNWYDRLKLS